MNAVFGCKKCGRAVEAECGTEVTCRGCGTVNALAAFEGDQVEGCLVCACPELYRHRDFNQKLGILMIVLGVILSLALSTFIPLALAAVVDLALYWLLPDVAICYRCKAHFRDVPGLEKIAAFDLERHEHYRFLKAREEGKIAPRTAAAEENPASPAEDETDA